MQAIPSDILAQFSTVLEKRAIPASRHADYIKWLRYYLDFRSKYTLPDSRSEHVRMFVQKLRDKGEAIEQQKEAAHALSLFFESQHKKRSESVKQDIGNRIVKQLQTMPFSIAYPQGINP